MDQPAAAAAPAFEVQPASEALTELGRLIVENPAFKTLPWEGITLVAYHEGTGVFGYVYLADGSWKAETPEGFDVLRRLQALNRAMADQGDASWKNALVQVRRRPEISIDAKFEYEDAERWRVNPSNLQERVEELRPR